MSTEKAKLSDSFARASGISATKFYSFFTAEKYGINFLPDVRTVDG